MLSNIASFFRYLQLFAHIAHNNAQGDTFFSDHEFLGSLYGTHEEAYDSIVERMIGLGDTQNLFILNDKANMLLQGMNGTYDNDESFQIILDGEKHVCGMMSEEIEGNKDLTQGTINLLAQLCDDSEVRQYKIGQRLKNDESERNEPSE